MLLSHLILSFSPFHGGPLSSPCCLFATRRSHLRNQAVILVTYDAQHIVFFGRWCIPHLHAEKARGDAGEGAHQEGHGGEHPLRQLGSAQHPLRVVVPVGVEPVGGP